MNVSGSYDEIYTAHGVAAAGMDFGGIPERRVKTGRVPDERTFKYFSEKGFELFRVGIVWERLQHSLNGELDPVMVAHLWDCINWAKKYNPKAKVIIDIHNYAKYDGNAIDAVEGGVTGADFCDLWVRIAKEFGNEPAVYSYGLMNEPVHVSHEKWYEISQAAVTAIRAAGDSKRIAVSGPEWSGIRDWPFDKEPWIKDPLNNIMYEGHQYFDRDYSGTYSKIESYAVLNELFGGDITAYFADIFQRWADWLNKYKVKGFLGEFATPYNDDGPEWNAMLDGVMEVIHRNGIDTSYWSAGPVWPATNNAIIQPLFDEVTGELIREARQMEILTKYKSGIVKVCR